MLLPDFSNIESGILTTRLPLRHEDVQFLESATSTAPYPARAVGMVGKGVTTKLAQKMTVVASAPATINEVAIGADMAITISTLLAATGYKVYAWVPQTIASATVLSGTPFGLMSLFAMGLSFDPSQAFFLSLAAQSLQRGHSLRPFPAKLPIQFSRLPMVVRDLASPKSLHSFQVERFNRLVLGCGSLYVFQNAADLLS